MIALIKWVYAKTTIISRQIWKFNRFAIIMEHEQKPTSAHLVSHVLLVVKWFRRRAKSHVVNQLLGASDLFVRRNTSLVQIFKTKIIY